jgi:hypothetical protein
MNYVAPPLPNAKTLRPETDTERYQSKGDVDATKYNYAVLTFIPRQKVNMQRVVTEMTEDDNSVDDVKKLSSSVTSIYRSEFDKLRQHCVAILKKQLAENYTEEELKWRQRFEELTTHIQNLFTHGVDYARIMMVKVRDIFATEEEADKAVKEYYSNIDPYNDHMIMKLGAWDGFVDEENALHVQLVNRNLYSAQRSVLSQVMEGFYAQLNDRKADLQFRQWSDKSTNETWNHLERLRKANKTVNARVEHALSSQSSSSSSLVTTTAPSSSSSSPPTESDNNTGDGGDSNQQWYEKLKQLSR